MAFDAPAARPVVVPAAYQQREVRLTNYTAVLALLIGAIGCGQKSERAPSATGTPGASSATPPATSSTPSAATRVLSCGEAIIRGEGIGLLRIGASVDSVRRHCVVVRDTTVLGAEGMPARKMAIAVAADTVEAEIVDNRVWRLAVLSPHLRTTDSLGVGTPLSRFLAMKKPRAFMGEGEVFLMLPSHCGLSFRLADMGSGRPRAEYDSAALARLPKKAHVSEVLVFGCRPAPARS